MTNEAHGLSDEYLSNIFDEVLDETKLNTNTSDTPSEDDTSDEADTKPASDDSQERDTTPDSISVVLAAIANADPKELRKFDSEVSPVLDAIAASDDETQMLVITLCNNQDLPAPPMVRTLSGLATRRSSLKREGKKVDFADLNRQVRSCLQGKLAWDEIAPKEYIEPKPDEDPDLVVAGELAALLRCTYVDVLALAGLSDGSGKTLVSRAKVTTALETLPTSDDSDKNVAIQDQPGIFDHEEPGNQPGDDDVVDVVAVQLPPIVHQAPVEEPPAPIDDSTPVTGYEFITVDPDDPLSELDDDWYVKSCQSLVEVLDS